MQGFGGIKPHMWPCGALRAFIKVGVNVGLWWDKGGWDNV